MTANVTPSHGAFVLAAGFGTRLRPLTDHRPKPLVPVCGVPLLAYTLALLARHGIRHAVVNAHHLAEALDPWAGEREDVQVTLSVERPEILGTGGGLKKVRDLLAPRFVVLNGDVLHLVDLGALLAAVPPGGGAMALRPDPANAPRYGVVAADAEGAVVQLADVARAPARGAVARDTHFTGIHALDQRALDHVPDGFACVVRTAYRALVPGRLVGAIRYGGPWLDAGDPAAYLEANQVVLTGQVSLALDPFSRAGFALRPDGRTVGDPTLVRGVHLKGPLWVGPQARVSAGAQLRRSIVGAGARIPAGAHLTDTVVWDGCTAPAAALHRAIVHPGGVWTEVT